MSTCREHEQSISAGHAEVLRMREPAPNWVKPMEMALVLAVNSARRVHLGVYFFVSISMQTTALPIGPIPRLEPWKSYSPSNQPRGRSHDGH